MSRLFGRAPARRVNGGGVEAGISRRMVLSGLGGAALAIPFLPSLLEKPAAAGLPITRPRFMWFGTDHGGCWDQNFFPTSVLTQTATAAPGHTVNAGALAPTTAGGRTTMSAVLSASSTTLTPTLTKKLNVLRGLDVPFYLAHNTGLHLGNYARNDGNGSCGTDVTNLGMRPTIDQVMASSGSFYDATDLTGTTLKSMVINPGRQLSWAFSNPAQGTASGVQYVQGAFELAAALQRGVRLGTESRCRRARGRRWWTRCSPRTTRFARATRGCRRRIGRGSTRTSP